MATIDILIPFIRSWEGGWSDDPDDEGGATMCGITLSTFTAWRESHGRPAPTKEELRGISDEEWTDIFRARYWNRLKADQIECQAVANIAVDWCWCSGIVAIKTLQRLCGTTVDGKVGPKTISAVNSRNPKWLFAQLLQARTEFLQELARKKPTRRKYLKGWLRRVNSITYNELILNR